MDKKGKRFADDNSGKTIMFDRVSEKEKPNKASERGAADEAPADKTPQTGEEIATKPDAEKAARYREEKRLKEKNSKQLEKHMKKQHRREAHTKREVLSYEDMPLEEIAEEKRAKRSSLSKKQIIAAVVIVAVLFAVVFIAANPERFSLNNISNFFRYSLLNEASDEKFPIDIKGEKITAGNFMRKGQDVCYSSDTKTQTVNSYGKTVYSYPHAFITPILVTSPKCSLVYNLGETGFQVLSNDKEPYTADAPDDIFVGDIIDSGVYALVTKSSGYLSKLYVYDEENTQIYAYSFADYYVTSVSLSSDGRHAVVAGVSALDGVNLASIYVLDFTKDTPLYFSEYENNIIYDVRYFNEKYACAVGRSSAYVINTRSGDTVEASYDGAALTAYDINTDTDTYTVCLSDSGDGRNCRVKSYRTNGAEDRSFEIDEKIVGISTYKGRVALMTSDEILLYSKDGRFVSSAELRSDPKAVVLYSGSDAYVLCTGFIDSISL